MKIVEVDPDDLVLSPELSRSGSTKLFEERLRSSIEEIGLSEPIKVAPLPSGRYLVIDGTLRLRAIRVIREKDPTQFPVVSAYVMDYERRYELRYQSDIYQDLLPSQLAGLVEHLHQAEHIRKVDIARYIGVSPATLRNYTGLWRLMQRGGLFARIVQLMDVGVIPSSNPYAWLRLTVSGLRKVLEDNFSDGAAPEAWIEQCALAARQGGTLRFPIKFVEATTDSLPPEYYREGEDVRSVKRDLGLRRASGNPAASADPPASPGGVAGAPADQAPAIQPKPKVITDKRDLGLRRAPDNPAASADPPASPGDVAGAPVDQAPAILPKAKVIVDFSDALRNLSQVSQRSPDLVLRTAARSLQEYLR